MKSYRVKTGDQRFLPAVFSLKFSPKRMNVTVSFPISEQPKKFDWNWNRLCGIHYLSGEEIGIGFRHNPLTKNIELCGYHIEGEEITATDYAPFPFLTLGTITVNISEEFIAFRFDIDGKVYIRRIDKEIYLDGVAYKIGAKMSEPSHTDIAIAMDFTIE